MNVSLTLINYLIFKGVQLKQSNKFVYKKLIATKGKVVENILDSTVSRIGQLSKATNGVYTFTGVGMLSFFMYVEIDKSINIPIECKTMEALIDVKNGIVIYYEYL